MPEGVIAHDNSGAQIVGINPITTSYIELSCKGPYWRRIGIINSNGSTTLLINVNTSWSYAPPQNFSFIFSQEWIGITNIPTKIKMLYEYGNHDVITSFRFVRDQANSPNSKTYFDIYYETPQANGVYVTSTLLSLRKNKSGNYNIIHRPDDFTIDPELLDTQLVNEYPLSEWMNLM